MAYTPDGDDSTATPNASSSGAPQSWDLTPKSSLSASRCSLWFCCRFLFGCCRPPAPSDVQQKLNDLQKQNDMLEAQVATLTQEKASLESRLDKEKMKKEASKVKRMKFKSKMADMHDKMKEDFGSDYEGSPKGESEPLFSKTK